MLVFVVGSGALYFWSQNFQRETVHARRGNLKQIVAAPGTIQAEKTANLKFGSTGRIIYLPYEEDDDVKKGAVVATIDTSDLKAIQTKELKDFEDARREFDRIKAEQEGLILSDEQKRDLADKQAALDRTIIDVEIADRSKKNASLYAPFSGVVTARSGEINEWTNVFSTEPLITIVDFSTLYFEAEVSEENSGLVKQGQEVTVNLDAESGKSYTGFVSKVARQVTKNNDGENVILVTVILNQIGENIKLGLKGDAKIVVGEKKDVLLISKNAVEKNESQTFVTVREGSFLRRRVIKLGTYDGTSWEVLDGLSESDVIISPK